MNFTELMKKNGSKNFRKIELSEDMFAIVFTINPIKAKIIKVESFMPPYDDLAPHVYMFVSYLSMIAGDETFFTRILTESFDEDVQNRNYTYDRRTTVSSERKNVYRTLEIGNNQIAIIMKTDPTRSTIRSSSMITTSFDSRLIYIYMFIEYLSQLCCQRQFFNEILFEGFNRLFVIEDDGQTAGAPQTCTAVKKGSERRRHIVLKENQLGIILIREEKRDAIKKVIPVVPPTIDQLSNVYAFVQSLAVLATQEYFFKKILSSGVNENFFQRRRMAALLYGEEPKNNTGYQVIMLSKRQYAIIFTADLHRDVITGVKTVFPSIDTEAPRVFMFIETLTSFMSKKFSALQNNQGSRQTMSSLGNSCPC